MMSHGLYPSENYNSGFSFFDISKIRKSGGKYEFSGVEHNDLPLIFIPDRTRMIMDANKKLNTVMGLAYAVVPSYWFESGGIEPEMDDFVKKPDGVMYRIVGIQDYRTWDGIYYLTLQRDQLDFGRS